MPSTTSQHLLEVKCQKKKKKKEYEYQANTSQAYEMQPDTEAKRMKKKRSKSDKSRSLSSGLTKWMSENQNFDSEKINQLSLSPDNEQSDEPVVKRKKEKKNLISGVSKSSSVSQDIDNVGHIPFLKDNEKKEKKKKKRKEREKGEERENDGDEECHDNMTRKKKKKKKKKVEGLSDCDENTIDHSNVSDEKGESEGDFSACATTVISDDKEEKEKKKKKKHKCKEPRKLSTDYIASDKNKHESNMIMIEECDDCNTPAKKKKKKKRKREEQESDRECIAVLEEEGNVEMTSSKKKKKKRDNDDQNSMDNDKDKGLPKSHTTPKSSIFKDAVFESAKRESQFSRVTGKPAEIENDEKNKMDSSSKAKIEETPSPPFVKGQWQGALFVNEERQNKFLRLLGGMKSGKSDKTNLFSSKNSSLKKGLYGSLSASVPNLNGSLHKAVDTKGGNALCISDAAEIDTRLEADYNKAMNFKLSGTKGAGLGFAPDPAEGKKFHIDANTTKSLKFDDDD